jgi:hypothetical protein
MSNEPQSDKNSTPRTDALYARWNVTNFVSNGELDAVYEHARELEREVAEAKAAHSDLLSRELGFSEAVEQEVARRCSRSAEGNSNLAKVLAEARGSETYRAESEALRSHERGSEALPYTQIEAAKTMDLEVLLAAAAFKLGIKPEEIGQLSARSATLRTDDEEEQRRQAYHRDVGGFTPPKS